MRHSRRMQHRRGLGLPVITLPFPVPSLPVVGPVVTQIINGKPTTVHQTTTHAPTTKAGGGGGEATSSPHNPSPTTHQGGGGNQPASAQTSPPPANTSPSSPVAGGDSSDDGQATSQFSFDPLSAASQATAANTALTLSGTVLYSIGDGSTYIVQIEPTLGNAASNPGVSSTNPTLATQAPGGAQSNVVFQSSSAGAETPGLSADANVTKPPLSKAGVALIAVTLTLLTIISALLLVRCAYRRKRERRRSQWMPVMSMRRNRDLGLLTPVPTSARSSFATNLDAGLSPLDAVAHLPPTPNNGRRDSTGSQGEDNAQWLSFNASSDQHLLPSPLSVRPFSPTEAYNFPRPPSMSGNLSSQGNPMTRTNTQVSLGSESMYSQPSDAHAAPDAPPVPKLILSQETTNTSVNKAALIKRSFSPTMPDELAVHPGETIYIETTFDDGWALTRKTVQNDVSETVERGLIPLACCVDHDDELTGFETTLTYGNRNDVHAKRRSSLIDF